jgi:uncharacterized 2Fe-2S/4Fe-4S cluster protein (DUF4445 family)
MTDNGTSKQPLVIFMPSGRRGRVLAGTAVLEAARQLGEPIESICGGHLTCRKCRVRLEEGDFLKHGITSQQSHLSPIGAEEQAAITRLNISGDRLSCQAQILGDVLISVPEESRGHKQIIRKSATARIINIDPAVRQVYVIVAQAELGEYHSDWERLQAVLAREWQVAPVGIDLPALRQLQPALREGKRAITVTIWQEREVIEVQPGYAEGMFGLAVDIGSTTLAGHLCDLRTGEILATESLMNPQVAYGEDLMSRIAFTTENKDGLHRLHRLIIEALNTLAVRAARSAGLQVRQIQEAVFVGNTTMIHLLLGLDPQALGSSPFALANRKSMDIKARDLGLRLHPCANVHVLPAEAGHVGADNVGVLIAEEPHKQDDIMLIVDVGTNAEIVLGNSEWLYSASSPTGPAFEGAHISHGMRAAHGAIERVRIDPITQEPRFRVIGEERWSDEWTAAEPPTSMAAGICGSGIIEVVAQLFVAGVIEENGRFNPNCHSARLVNVSRHGAYLLATAAQTTNGQPLVITQDDIRSVQLAKGALYAGAKLLMRRAGVAQVDRVVLAGAFGSIIDPQQAMILGLFPQCDLAKVTAVGNAAGDGARIALLNRQKRLEAQALIERITYVETAVDPEFQAGFVAALHLPHALDQFPAVADLLPKKTAVTPPIRRHKRHT